MQFSSKYHVFKLVKDPVPPSARALSWFSLSVQRLVAALHRGHFTFAIIERCTSLVSMRAVNFLQNFKCNSFGLYYPLMFHQWSTLAGSLRTFYTFFSGFRLIAYLFLKLKSKFVLVSLLLSYESLWLTLILSALRPALAGWAILTQIQVQELYCYQWLPGLALYFVINLSFFANSLGTELNIDFDAEKERLQLFVQRNNMTVSSPSRQRTWD